MQTDPQNCVRGPGESKEGTKMSLWSIFQRSRENGCDWNVKLWDDCRVPWKLDCDSFKKLLGMCEVIETCCWNESGTRQKKLTKFTADAFLVTTKFNIAAANYLLADHNFNYVLPAVFSQDHWKFFWTGQAALWGKFLYWRCWCFGSSESATFALALEIRRCVRVNLRGTMQPVYSCSWSNRYRTVARCYNSWHPMSYVLWWHHETKNDIHRIPHSEIPSEWSNWRKRV